MQEIKIWLELYLVCQGDKFFIPPVCYSLFSEEKKSFYGWFIFFIFIADVIATTSRYHYLPSKGVAITFISLYSVSGGSHIAELYFDSFTHLCTILALHLGEGLYGRLYWMLPTVVLGLVGEIIGWACRYWSTFSGGLARTPYIAQCVSYKCCFPKRY